MSAAPFAPLDAARAADPARYAMAGVAPRFALRPANRDEAAEAVRAADRDGLGVVPWGGGTSLPRETAPAGYDVALDLGALDRIVEHEPEDFTITVECGVTIAALRARLAAGGQELPLESPHAARATIGGVIAANASGARRLRFGSVRDRILGACMVLGDGSLARTGGRVVKNVAGYAVHRLACGARGGLVAVVEASFKLAAPPARRVALAWGASAEQIGDAARWSAFPRLEPAALTVMGRERARGLPLSAGAPFTAILVLEDDAAWIEQQIARAVAALGPPAGRLEGAEVAALEQALADLGDPAGASLAFTTAANTASALAPLAAHPAAARAVLHAPAGRLHVAIGPGEAQPLADLLHGAGFARIEAIGVESPRPLVARESAIGDLRAKLREAIDPGRRFALGERWVSGAD